MRARTPHPPPQPPFDQGFSIHRSYCHLLLIFTLYCKKNQRPKARLPFKRRLLYSINQYSSTVIIKNPLIYWAFSNFSTFSRQRWQTQPRTHLQRPWKPQQQSLVSSYLPTFSEPSPMSLFSRSSFALRCSVPRLTHFYARSNEVLGKPTRTRESTILPKTTQLYTISRQPRKGSSVNF